MDASTSTGASVFSSAKDQDQFSTSDNDALTTTVVTTITNVTGNTTTTGRFNWIIQTVTVPQTVTPPTIVVGSDYYYYYVWWFYSFLTILFLISMCMLVAKLAQQRRRAMARQAAALSARQNVTTNVYNAGNSNAAVNMTEINNNATTVLEDVTDLPPAYDDVIQIVNAKLELQAAEEGAVGGMTSAISTSTMETNVDMDGSAADISAVGMITPTLLPPYAYESSANNNEANSNGNGKV